MVSKLRKVLIIGMDGATFDILGPLMDEGWLPNLAKLRANGVWGKLRTTIPPVSASAWVSFATGKNPGKHGLFDFVFPRPDGYEVCVANVTYRSGRAFWEYISDAGGQVGLVNVPITYPPASRPVNGFVASCFLAPNFDSPWTYPDGLKYELRDAVGEFPLIMSEAQRSGDVLKFIQEMRDFDLGRVKHVLYLMKNKTWDLFAFVFSSTDTLQHELWHLLDPGHPRHDAQQASRYHEAIWGFYADIDHALGQLIDAAGEDALILIMSDHGAGPFQYFFHVNNWLHSLGLLRWKRNPVSMAKYTLYRLGFTPVNVLKMVTFLRLSRLRKNVKRGRGVKMLKRVFLSFNDVDWSHTAAFAVGNFGQIYINLAGKRTQGIVRSGAEYEALRDRIIREALALRDPETGEAVIQYAYRKEEIYYGESLVHAPDIILHTDRSKYVSFGHADFGSNRILEPSFGQTGHHQMDGILMICGEQIQRGKKIEGAQIIDLAPTLLYAMGLPVPSDMDGRVLSEAFASEYMSANPVRYEEVGCTKRPESEDYSEEDEERVMQRLRDLGYVS
ncbi:MAG: alkaline phosphatase family protein [Chloroflexi bacterium]|nr:alkaline phosphatase family protein [Chloroflexota bacterium]